MAQNYNYRMARERNYTDCVYQRRAAQCDCVTCSDRFARAAAKRQRREDRNWTLENVGQPDERWVHTPNH